MILYHYLVVVVSAFVLAGTAEPFHSNFWQQRRALAGVKQFQANQMNPYLPIPPTTLLANHNNSTERLKVGIIGAGTAGLYTAMIFDSFGIDYEILEANSRTGGRAFTYKFGNGTSKWNYFDAGAMRFPDIPIMWRLFDLFRNKAKVELLPYIFNSPKQSLLYNGIRYQGIPEVPQPDLFHDLTSHAGLVPDDKQQWIEKGVDHWMNQCLDPFKKLLADGFEEGYNIGEGPRWDLFMKYDKYSVRSFMGTAFDDKDDKFDFVLKKPAYPPDVINWLERMTFGTNQYDLGFTDLLLDELDFAYPCKGNNSCPYYCVSGGTEELTKAMTANVNSHAPGRIHLNSRVTSIALGDDKKSVVVGYKEGGKKKSKTFTHVISTTSLSTLRLIDTDHAGLSYGQREATRTLHYAASSKVGMKFKSRWWQEKLGIYGGQSKTDRLIRTAVFPSYGIHDPHADAVMIASYTWHVDAERVGGLIKGRNTQAEYILVVENMLKDLAVLHDVSYDFLKDQLVDWYAWDWAADPNTLGAFGFFGPGEFSGVYPKMGQPAAHGRLFFSGEALSPQHGWIAGALDSAYAAVYKLFYLSGSSSPSTEELENKWGHKSQGKKFEGEEKFAKEWEEVMRNQALIGAVFSESLGNEASQTDKKLWISQKFANLAAAT